MASATEPLFLSSTFSDRIRVLSHMTAFLILPSAAVGLL